jgi:hypothetical protein
VKPFIEASTGHAAKKQEHKPYMTTCAGQTYRQNSQSNNRTKRLPVSIEMLPAVQTVWSFCWIQMPVLFLHNSHLITSSDRKCLFMSINRTETDRGIQWCLFSLTKLTRHTNTDRTWHHHHLVPQFG